MVTPLGRKYLQWSANVMAFFAFFGGVYMTVWGVEFTSPVWVFLMSGPWHGLLWGFIFFVAGGLFLWGLQWKHWAPRVAGAGLTGTFYIAVGVVLGIAPILGVEDSLNGSWGMWILCGVLHWLLAGLMYAERDHPQGMLSASQVDDRTE